VSEEIKRSIKKQPSGGPSKVNQKKERDPMGKSALFLSQPLIQQPIKNEKAPLGRKILFSNPDKPLNKANDKAPLELTCSECKVVSYVEPFDFLKNALPVVIWLPWKEYGNFMICPNCHKRSWVKVRLTLLTNLGL